MTINSDDYDDGVPAVFNKTARVVSMSWATISNGDQVLRLTGAFRVLEEQKQYATEQRLPNRDEWRRLAIHKKTRGKFVQKEWDTAIEYMHKCQAQFIEMLVNIKNQMAVPPDKVA